MKVYTSKTDLIGDLSKQLGDPDNDRQAIKGLLTVFANQTDSEQHDGTVRCDNGIGFTCTDAEILTSYANQVIAWKKDANLKKKYKKPLSPKQLAFLKKKMPKYATQLIEHGIARGVIYKEGGQYKFRKLTEK